MCKRIPDVGHTPPWDVTLMMVCSAFFLDFFSAACFAGGFCANMSYFIRGYLYFAWIPFFSLVVFWSPYPRVSAAIPLEA